MEADGQEQAADTGTGSGLGAGARTLAGGEAGMQSVLVTGGCGFIASNFLNIMVNKYPLVQFVNVDRLDYCASQNNLAVRNCANYVFYQLDICDHKPLAQVLVDHKIDTVVHFAAQTHVDLSFENSVEFTKTNVLGTHHLLEACRGYGRVNRFIQVSTDEVYGEVLEGKSTTQSLLNPTNPYAASKAAAEHIVNAYYKSFKFPSIIVRCNNVYGPRQYPDKLIPKFIAHLLRGERCPIHGDGAAKRNFIHVDDVVAAFDVILRRGTLNHVYNIGTDAEFSVLDILDVLVRRLCPPTADVAQHAAALEAHSIRVEDRKFNDKRYAVDADAIKQLGWSPIVDFQQGLEAAIAWYRVALARGHWKDQVLG